jgi:hypothetical protein
MGRPMDEPEDFLSRWSRLKRDRGPERGNGSEPKDRHAAVPSEPPEASTGTGIAMPRDRAVLPSIESIDAGSDIQAFLEPGVPADLTRAALRRAWTSDLSIRDFVGLSESSWDFNAPGAIFGFGSIETERIQSLLDRAFGMPAAPEEGKPPSAPMIEGGRTAQARTSAGPTEPTDVQPSPEASSPETCVPGMASSHEIDMTQRDGFDMTLQPSAAPAPVEAGERPSQHRHGGALPEAPGRKAG